MVTKNEMDKYWKLLSLAYVTEESDESDDPDNPNGIVEHKLDWRSESKFFLLAIRHITLLIVLKDFPLS